MEYCPKCKEYKGLMECVKCGQLYCSYCDLDGDASCDTHGDIIEYDIEEEMFREIYYDLKRRGRFPLNECE